MTGDPAVDGGLFAPIVTTDALLEATSDAAWVQAMLDVEAALARSRSARTSIPAGAADAVGAGRAEFRPRRTRSGRPRRRATRSSRSSPSCGRGSAEPARTGSTTVRPARTSSTPRRCWWRRERSPLIGGGAHRPVRRVRAALADEHRARPSWSRRTLLQHALPITFGLKAAGWLTAAAAARTELRRIRDRLPVQLGGAAGTLASLGERGSAVAGGLAAELGLSCPPLPWHTDRTVVAELAADPGNGDRRRRQDLLGRRAPHADRGGRGRRAAGDRSRRLVDPPPQAQPGGAPPQSPPRTAGPARSSRSSSARWSTSTSGPSAAGRPSGRR